MSPEDKKKRDALMEKLQLRILRIAKGKWYKPRFINKWREKRLWNEIEVMYGERYKSTLFNILLSNEFIIRDDKNRGIITERGKRLVKRGWIYTEKKWYDADPIRKYSFILSVSAFVISIIGSDNIRKFFVFLFEKITSR